jgi:hypothetical protein
LDNCLLWTFVYFGPFFKLAKIAQNFWATFNALVLTKNGLGHILGDFSQTHLVTLAAAFTSRTT